MLAKGATPKLKRLEGILAEIGGGRPVIVAFSGGVDSALLAKVANDVLGDDTISATAVSPSLASLELEHCKKISEEWGLKWVSVETTEMELEQYRQNDTDRCYWCKDSLMDALIKMGEELDPKGTPRILLGVNTDDLKDFRPGIDAAKNRGALFPFLDAELSKADIREISQELGLQTWDKPAQPCLASRVPFGTQISEAVLLQVDQAETSLREMGFLNLRVRHHEDTARIEVSEADFPAVLKQRDKICAAIKAAGYKFVTLDLEGLRTGSLLPVNINRNGNNS